MKTEKQIKNRLNNLKEVEKECHNAICNAEAALQSNFHCDISDEQEKEFEKIVRRSRKLLRETLPLIFTLDWVLENEPSKDK